MFNLCVVEAVGLMLITLKSFHEISFNDSIFLLGKRLNVSLIHLFLHHSSAGFLSFLHSHLPAALASDKCSTSC